jgi:hypothetical protein
MDLTRSTNRMTKGAAINVLDFGATGDGVTDDTAAIQAAVYATGDYNSGVTPLYFPAGTYIISSPILFYAMDGLHIYGDQKVSSIIKPIGAMTPVLDAEFTALQALGYDDYTAVPACFIISTVRMTGASPLADWGTEAKNSGTWHVEIERLGFIGGDAGAIDTVAGIYAPVIAHSKFSELLFHSLLIGFKTEVTWRMLIDHCDFTYINGAAISTVDSALRSTSGTSVTLNACGIYNSKGGFALTRMSYSTLINCACDNWNRTISENGTVQAYAYSFTECTGLTLINCACEDTQFNYTKGIFNLQGTADSSTSIIGGSYATHSQAAAGTAVSTLNGGKLTLDGTRYINSSTTANCVWELLDGDVIVRNVQAGTSYPNTFSWPANVSFYGGNQSLNFSATARNVAMVAGATTTDLFGSTFSWVSTYGSYDQAAGKFTAPFEGVYKIDITLRFLGAGVETVTVNGVLPAVSLIQDQETNFDAASTGIQTYSFSTNQKMFKGGTIYTELVTTAGATGTIKLAQFSVAQIS